MQHLRSLARGRVRLATGLVAAALAAGTALAWSPALAWAQDTGAATQLVHDAGRKLREQDLGGALRLLEQAVAADPGNAAAHAMYQDTARQVVGPADVIQRYRKLAAEKPDDALYAYLAARLDDPEAAAQAFEKLVLKFPKSPWPLLGKAHAYEQLGRTQDALAALEAALSLAPSDAYVRAVHAYALERAQRWSDAADAWRRVVELAPRDSSARIGLGECLRNAGVDEDAVAAFGEAAAADPKDPDPPYRIGLVHLQAGRITEALASFEQALALDRGMVEALCGAAEAALKRAIDDAKAKNELPDEKQLQTALDYAVRAAAANPESARAHFAQGAVYEAFGEFDAVHLDKSLEEYQAALDRLSFPGPPRVRVLVARSYVLLRLARWDEAEQTAVMALDIDPKNIPAMLHAGHALSQTGKYEEALKKYYKVGLKIAKDDPRLLFGAGMASWGAFKHNDARKYIEDAVKADEENGLYRLALGDLYYELKKNKEAEVQLQVAVELRPKDPVAWSAYGRACSATQNWTESAAAFEKVCELNEDAVDEYEYLAIIYGLHLKDAEKAKAAAKKFAEKGGSDPNIQSFLDDLVNGS